MKLVRDPALKSAAYGFVSLAIIFWLASIMDVAWWLAVACLVLAAITAFGGLVGFPAAPVDAVAADMKKAGDAWMSNPDRPGAIQNDAYSRANKKEA